MATAAAKRYARAVFELAQQEGTVDEWARRIAKVRELFDDPEVAAVLSNPTIAIREREALVATAPKLFDAKADKTSAASSAAIDVRMISSMHSGCPHTRSRAALSDFS